MVSILDRYLIQLLGRGDTGVAHEDVDRAELPLRRRDHLVELRRVAHVATHRHRPPAQLGGSGRDRLGGLRVAPYPTATSAPARARRSAIAAPIPRIAPVTNATRPSRLMLSSTGARSTPSSYRLTLLMSA